MNEIFKLFKKRSQSGKTANLTEILQEFNDKDNASNFDRSNQKYISISKSGRVKSKKSHQTNRVLKEELFQPAQQPQQQQQAHSSNASSSTLPQKNIPIQNQTVSTGNSSHYNKNPLQYNHYNFNQSTNRHNTTKQQTLYDQHSDNADSSRTSSASQSSLEDFNTKSINSYNTNLQPQQQPARSAYNFPSYNPPRTQRY